MNREAPKLYRFSLAFDKSVRIPIVRWGCVRTGFRMNPKDRLAPLKVIRGTVRERSRMPEIPLGWYGFPEPTEAAQRADRAECRKVQFDDPMNYGSLCKHPLIKCDVQVLCVGTPRNRTKKKLNNLTHCSDALTSSPRFPSILINVSTNRFPLNCYLVLIAIICVLNFRDGEFAVSVCELLI
jgi:hypothetical protein